MEVASRAGLIGRRRVLDSAPIYDAVATQDTVTLIRSAIRSLSRAADRDLRVELRALISSADAYTDLAKPVIDWRDAAERAALIDTRARDGFALLAVLDGRKLVEGVRQAARLPGHRAGPGLGAGHLARGRANNADPVWLARYRATRPKVERKIAHLMRRRHGGRRARVRRTVKIDADFSLLVAAVNLARLAVLGIVSAAGGAWMTAAP
ncbi:hypothetical protein Acor_67430 [Acrocarpospora corrugata]|uniref:Transposase DDE domain-containing protein n=1 Tax=Acrocarpospora corrugata TaxID=35763 RepID=A0A5M3W6M2_9ACTN|nr:transposase [Acrocarpospora corrugata]GES04675.1 hypothetical protein Acor_67430 [Acrocarpospora corrugata]